MKFERNEIIEFKGVPTFSAKKGAKAVCKGYFRLHDDEMLDVEWIRNGDDNGQIDGGYHEECFVKVEEVSTQKEDRILSENKKDMKFKEGDILEFNGGGRIIAAIKGAKAICKGYYTNYDFTSSIEYIRVEWIRNGDSNDQEDGLYYEECFVKVEEVSTQKEDRILSEIKKEKVMKFDLEKGKQGLVEYFQGDFDRANEYSLEYIKSCDDMDDVEREVRSFRAFKEEHKKVISRIERANTLSSVFEALEDTAIEDDDETILSFFIEGLQ